MTAWFVAAILLASPGDGWNNLKRVTRDRIYALMMRNGECEYGTLSSIGEQALVLGTDSGLGLAIKRSQIARVSDNLTAPDRDPVFSARSSWLDVQTAANSGVLQIVSKHGDEWKWKQPAVSDESIASEGITVAKEDIRYVIYIRSKPLNIDEEYFHQVDFKWVAAIPWLGDLAARIRVMIYNSDLVEDNSPLACRR